MPSVCLSCFLWFYAADDVVFSCIRKRKSSVLQCRNNNFIIIISRKSDTCTGKLSCLDQQFMRRAVPYTNRKRRHRKENMFGCLNAHKGQIVGHIFSIFVLTAYDQVLEKAVAGKSLCGCCITTFVQVIQFNPDTVEQFLCKFSGQHAFIQIRFIIRIHILVKTSRRNRMPTGFHLKKLLYKPEGLTSLIECSCAFSRNIAAVLSDHEKFRSSLWILTLCCHLLCQSCITLCVFDNSLTA